MEQRILVPFDSWEEARAFVETQGYVYYHAPLDPRPRWIAARLTKRGIRLSPPFADADPFTADREHLSRMRKPLES